MVLFMKQKDELKIRKGCMQLKKEDMCQVIMDKGMKGRLQHGLWMSFKGEGKIIMSWCNWILQGFL